MPLSTKKAVILLRLPPLTRPLDAREIPARGFSERNGKDRAIAVHDIETEEHRDVQAAVLDRELLQGPSRRSADDIEHRSHPSCADGLIVTRAAAACRRRSGRIEARGQLVQLSDLFLEGHLREQRADAGLALRSDPRGGLGAERDRHDQTQDKRTERRAHE